MIWYQTTMITVKILLPDWPFQWKLTFQQELLSYQLFMKWGPGGCFIKLFLKLQMTSRTTWIWQSKWDSQSLYIASAKGEICRCRLTLLFTNIFIANILFATICLSLWQKQSHFIKTSGKIFRHPIWHFICKSFVNSLQTALWKPLWNLNDYLWRGTSKGKIEFRAPFHKTCYE